MLPVLSKDRLSNLSEESNSLAVVQGRQAGLVRPRAGVLRPVTGPVQQGQQAQRFPPVTGLKLVQSWALEGAQSLMQAPRPMGSVEFPPQLLGPEVTL